MGAGASLQFDIEQKLNDDSYFNGDNRLWETKTKTSTVVHNSTLTYTGGLWCYGITPDDEYWYEPTWQIWSINELDRVVSLAGTSQSFSLKNAELMLPEDDWQPFGITVFGTSKNAEFQLHLQAHTYLSWEHWVMRFSHAIYGRAYRKMHNKADGKLLRAVHSSNHEEVTRLLKEGNADIRSLDECGATPLAISIRRNNVNTLASLLNNATGNSTLLFDTAFCLDSLGSHSIHSAVAIYKDIFSEDIKDRRSTCLGYLCSYLSTHSNQYNNNNKNSVNDLKFSTTPKRRKSNHNLLNQIALEAATQRSPMALTLAIDSGANLFAVDSIGQTVGHLALVGEDAFQEFIHDHTLYELNATAIYKCISIISEIAAGVLDLADENGYTPLHLATFYVRFQN